MSGRAGIAGGIASKDVRTTPERCSAFAKAFSKRITELEHRGRWPLIPQCIVDDAPGYLEDGIVALDNGMYKIWFARNYRTYVANMLLLDNALTTGGCTAVRRWRQ